MNGRDLPIGRGVTMRARGIVTGKNPLRVTLFNGSDVGANFDEVKETTSLSEMLGTIRCADTSFSSLPEHIRFHPSQWANTLRHIDEFPPEKAAEKCRAISFLIEGLYEILKELA